MTEYKCQCGHFGSDHPYIKLRRGYEKKCNHCSCEKFVNSSTVSIKGDTIADVTERFRLVLREKYQEHCPNCDKHLEITDIDLGIVEPENKYRNLFTHRVVCQNCFTKVIELVVSAFQNLTVSDYIRFLNDPLRFKAKVNVYK
jgi:hypothetical protein